MSKNSADPDELSILLAERTGRDAEEIRLEAGEFEIEAPDESDWEPLDADWKESPAHQEY